MRAASLLLATLSLAAVGCAAADAGGGFVAPSDRQVVDVGGAPTRGPANAAVVVVEFADFECPYCGEEEPVVTKLLQSYDGKLRFAFKQFPLSSIHPEAETAAEASLAADAQGEFWPLHDAMYANQDALAKPDIEAEAKGLGLDVSALDAALAAGTFEGAVAADVAQGNALGVPATPTFFVNGRMAVGALPYETLAASVDEELAAAEK